jgi:hypothetical protein
MKGPREEDTFAVGRGENMNLQSQENPTWERFQNNHLPTVDGAR